MKDPKAASIIGELFSSTAKDTHAQTEFREDSQGAISSEMMEATTAEMPIRGLISFVPGFRYDDLHRIVEQLNK